MKNVDSQGFGDFDDVMTGVDSLIEQGIADSNRLGVMGWSYGGYLTAWIIGHTDRFKAMSSGAGAVALARPYVDQPVFIIFVDTIFDADLSVVNRTDADGIIWVKTVDDRSSTSKVTWNEPDSTGFPRGHRNRCMAAREARTASFAHPAGS